MHALKSGQLGAKKAKPGVMFRCILIQVPLSQMSDDLLIVLAGKVLLSPAVWHQQCHCLVRARISLFKTYCSMDLLENERPTTKMVVQFDRLRACKKYLLFFRGPKLILYR